MTARRLRTRLAPAALAAAGAALLLAGPPAVAKTRTASLGSYYFAPGKLAVKTGDKVRFEWDGGEVHDVGVTSGPVEFRSPLQAGGSWTTKRLRKAGTYRLGCSVHPQMAMTLKVKRR